VVLWHSIQSTFKHNINIPQKISSQERVVRSCQKFLAILWCIHHKLALLPFSREIEAERMPRSRFKNVSADSHSEIILVTEEGSPAFVSEDPTARAACESLRFLKFPRNCHKSRKKSIPMKAYMATSLVCLI